jgi:hypothetical protein
MMLRMRIGLCFGDGSLNMSTPSEGKARKLGGLPDVPAPRVEHHSGRPSSPLLLQAVFHMGMVMTPMAVVIGGYPSPSKQEVKKNQG